MVITDPIAPRLYYKRTVNMYDNFAEARHFSLHGMYNVREVELKVCIKHSVLHNINTHLIETPLPKMLVIPLLLNQITFCFFSFICTKKGQS